MPTKESKVYLGKCIVDIKGEGEYSKVMRLYCEDVEVCTEYVLLDTETVTNIVTKLSADVIDMRLEELKCASCRKDSLEDKRSKYSKDKEIKIRKRAVRAKKDGS